MVGEITAAGLGESSKSLKDSILKKPIQFVKSWMEWAAINLDQVIEAGSATIGGTSTFYTVPKNKTLYITSFVHSSEIIGGGAGTDTSTLQIDQASFSGNGRFSSHIHVKAAADHVTTASGFPMPLKVEEKGVIQILNTSNNVITSAAFTGFLIDKKIS